MIELENFQPIFDIRNESLPFDQNDFINFILKANEISLEFGLDYILDKKNFIFMVETLNIEITLDIEKLLHDHEKPHTNELIHSHFLHLEKALKSKDITLHIHESNIFKSKYFSKDGWFLHWKPINTKINTTDNTIKTTEHDFNLITGNLNNLNIKHNYFEVYALHMLCERITNEFDITHSFKGNKIYFTFNNLNIQIYFTLEEGINSMYRNAFSWHSSILKILRTEIQKTKNNIALLNMESVYYDEFLLKSKSFIAREITIFQWSLINTSLKNEEES